MSLLEQLVSLSTAKIRVCQTMHQCCLCDKTITLGESYHDRGFGRRAHTDCVRERANRLANAMNDWIPPARGEAGKR